MCSDKAGFLRCDLCAELRPTEEINVCEQCERLYCYFCASEIDVTSSYHFCEHCC